MCQSEWLPGAIQHHLSQVTFVIFPLWVSLGSLIFPPWLSLGSLQLLPNNNNNNNTLILSPFRFYKFWGVNQKDISEINNLCVERLLRSPSVHDLQCPSRSLFSFLLSLSWSPDASLTESDRASTSELLFSRTSFCSSRNTCLSCVYVRTQITSSEMGKPSEMRLCKWTLLRLLNSQVDGGFYIKENYFNCVRMCSICLCCICLMM